MAAQQVGTKAAGSREGAPTSGSAVIDVRGLVKCFGSLRAVDGISFHVERGETLGLLGPNGAGKTSVMRVLSGLSPVDAGTVRVSGIDAVRQGRAVRRLLGVVTQDDGLDPDVNARQNLELYGFLAGLSRREARARTAEVLRFFGLTKRAEDAVDELSGGMRRRLAIARAFVCHPTVVVLDEPTTGLDPHSRTRVWEELAKLKSRGVSILMSTHYMEEAATLCDRVAIMDRGRILALGPPPVLVERHAGRSVAELRLNGASREKVRSELAEAGFEWLEVGAIFRISGDGAAAAKLESIPGVRVDLRAATLEDVYMSLTGKELREE